MISDPLLAESAAPIVAAVRQPVEPSAAGAPSRLRASAQDLLAALLGARIRPRPGAAPRVHIRISVYRPNGEAAVLLKLGAGGK